MNYDRRLHKDFLTLALPGAPLGWLHELVRGPEGGNRLLDVQFRGHTQGGYAAQAIQLYSGRTSLLEIDWGGGLGRVGLSTHPTYSSLDPGLFGDWSSVDLGACESRVRRFLTRVAERVSPQFFEGEARLQAQFSRRYGLLGGRDAPVRVIDREAQISFTDTDERIRTEGFFLAHVGMGWQSHFARKLDAVGVLSDGAPALIEFKRDSAGLADAAGQLACYAYQFRSLAEKWPRWARNGLTRLAKQKAELGLLPEPPTAREGPPALIIAAPDSRSTWVAEWQKAIETTRRSSGGLLDALELWRLHDDGSVRETHRA